LEDVKKLAQEVCERERCLVWDIEMTGTGRGRTLRITIEGQDQQVSIQDCERVSKGLNLLLDVKDVVPGGAYHLEVSSPGIERTLKELWHFEKSAGQNVEMLLHEPLPIEKGDPLRIKGTIQSVAGQTIMVESSDGQVVPVEFVNVKKARTVFIDKKEKRGQKNGR
jgi:ribosome maturation factor RimP